MAEFNIGKLRGVQGDDLLAPQHAGFQDIRFVHRTDPALPRARQFKSGPRHAANLIGGVLLGVEAATLPVGERLDAARFPKIHSADELTDDDEIDALSTRALSGADSAKAGLATMGLRLA